MKYIFYFKDIKNIKSFVVHFFFFSIFIGVFFDLKLALSIPLIILSFFGIYEFYKDKDYKIKNIDKVFLLLNFLIFFSPVINYVFFDEGIGRVQMKLSFIALPMIFYSLKKYINIKILLYSFICVSIVTLALNMIHIFTVQDTDVQKFMIDPKFSKLDRAGYSLLIILTMIVSAFFILNKSKNKLLHFLLILIQFGVLLIWPTRISIFTAVLIFVILGLFYYKILIKSIVFYTSILILSLIGAYFAKEGYFNEIAERFTKSNVVYDPRYYITKCSFDIMEYDTFHYLNGFGSNSNLKDNITRCYKDLEQNGYKEGAWIHKYGHNFFPHNGILFAFLNYGIVGLLAILGYLLFPFFVFLYYKSWHMLIFGVSQFTVSMFHIPHEILENSVPFCFIYTVIFFYFIKKDNSNKELVL